MSKPELYEVDVLVVGRATVTLWANSPEEAEMEALLRRDVSSVLKVSPDANPVVRVDGASPAK